MARFRHWLEMRARVAPPKMACLGAPTSSRLRHETGNDCRMCSSMSFMFAPLGILLSSPCGRGDDQQAKAKSLGWADAARKGFVKFGRVNHRQHAPELHCAMQAVLAVFLEILTPTGEYAQRGL